MNLEKNIYNLIDEIVNSVEPIFVDKKIIIMAKRISVPLLEYKNEKLFKYKVSI